jgi:soluble lytic murein transglycosylase
MRSIPFLHQTKTSFLLGFLVFFCLHGISERQAHAGGVAQDFQTWKSYVERSKKDCFTNVVHFLKTHPNWPQIHAIQAYAEEMLYDDWLKQDPAVIDDFFNRFPPVSGKGSFVYAMLLQRTHKIPQLKKILHHTLSTHTIHQRVMGDMIKNFAHLIDRTTIIHCADQILAKSALDQANWFKNALKQHLCGFAASERSWIKQFIQTLEHHLKWLARPVNPIKKIGPNVYGYQLLDYLRFYRKANDNAQAISLLQRGHHFVHQSPHEKRFPAAWSKERRILARRFMEEKKWKQAHDVLLHHQHTDGVDYADTQWLIGFLKLKLRQGASAAQTFATVHGKVKAPISLARMAFWAAASFDQQASHRKAKDWYQKAALHSHTYYGRLAQLTLKKKGHKVPAYPLSKTKPGSIKTYPYFSMLEQIRSCNPAPQTLELFFVHFLKHLSCAQQRLRCFFHAMGISPSLGVSLAKKSLDPALMQHVHAYPKLPTDLVGRTSRAIQANHYLSVLAHAVIRQESNFNPMAVSCAGAKGLMQLMDSTARIEERTFPVAGLFSKNDSIFSINKNVPLGMHHLHRVLNEWDGHVVLALACYNAGPVALKEWISIFGDPRKGDCDIINWIECIPFGETRNYVQRCVESFLIYGEILHKKSFDLLHVLKKGL